jgi:hypothetical protein
VLVTISNPTLTGCKIEQFHLSKTTEVEKKKVTDDSTAICMLLTHPTKSELHS